MSKSNPIITGPAAKLGIRLLGAILAVIGGVLAVGGVWLAAIGGSPYYLLAGVALLAGGALLIRLRRLGLIVYAATFALTFIWALWEVGLSSWALIPRLFGPAVLMILVLWAATRIASTKRGRQGAWVALGAFVIASVLFGAVVHRIDRPAAALPIPAAAAAMADWPAYGGTDVEDRQYAVRLHAEEHPDLC